MQTAQTDLPPQPQPQADRPEADAPRQPSAPSDHAPTSDIAISRQAAAAESDQGTQKEGPVRDTAEEPRRSAVTEATNWQSLSDLLRLAVQAQEAGRASEARPLLECIVALSKDTPTGDEAAQRLRLLAHEEKKQRDVAERQLVADVLRRATEEQAAGRLVEARRLLQWVATISQGTPSAEEAARRLRDLEQAQCARAGTGGRRDPARSDRATGEGTGD